MEVLDRDNSYIIKFYNNHAYIHCNYSHYYFNQQSAFKQLATVHEATALLFLQPELRPLFTNINKRLHSHFCHLHYYVAT